MPRIYGIRDYEETLAVFSTRELAERALEKLIRIDIDKGYYGHGDRKPDSNSLEWIDGKLYYRRWRCVMKECVSQEIYEMELDRIPW